MNSIEELISRLPAVTKVSIDVQHSQPILYPIKDTITNLQLAFYWWKEAVEDLNLITTGAVIQEGEHNRELLQMLLPTLIGAKEQLDYLEKELNTLAEEVDRYLLDAVIPETVGNKVRQGYNKIKEAYFTVKISNIYYDVTDQE